MIGCGDLTEHIIAHEILGVGSSSSVDLLIVDGYPTYIDTSRGNKRLSVPRSTFKAGRKFRASNVYLRTEDNIASSKTGYRMLHNGTITGISIQTSTTSTYNIEIRRNDLIIPLLNISVSSSTGYSSFSINTDFNQNDIIQFYINGLTNNPICWIEVAWRF